MLKNSTVPATVYLRDIMTTPVHTVDLDEPIQNVAKLFDREKFHHVVVLRRSRVFGVVSDRDILKEISPFVGNRLMERSQDLNTMKKRVHQVMSRDVTTSPPDQTIAEGAATMLDRRVSCLPIVDTEHSLLGIVTMRDFVACSVHTERAVRDEYDTTEHDDGILVVIDGVRCYYPHAAIGRLLREAEAAYQKEHRAGSARPAILPCPTHLAGSPSHVAAC